MSPFRAATKFTSSHSGADDARAAGCETLVDLLGYRVETSPDRVVYRFLPGDAKPEQTITYRELDRRARALAAVIGETTTSGDRALLLVPPGLDYVAAYFGCLYAGVIAVPAYPPNPRRPDPRIPRIVEDSQPAVALTTTPLLAKLDPWRGGDERLGALRWIAVDDTSSDAAAASRDNGVRGSDVALL